MEIWTPKVGDDSLYLKCEDENKHDKYAVALVIRGKTLDLHRKTSVEILSSFVIECIVVGNQIN